MIRVKLREMMEHRQRGSAERITYDWLAKKTALSRATLEAIGSRPSYNPRLSTIERLCEALQCTPSQLLELSSGRPRARRRR